MVWGSLDFSFRFWSLLELSTWVLSTTELQSCRCVFFWLYLCGALQICIWSCAAVEQILVKTQVFCLNLHLYTIHFVFAMSLPVYWFRQGFCPLSTALLCRVRLGKEVVFTRLMDLFGLFPLSCLFERGMPLKVTSLSFQMLRSKKCVRKCEYALKYPILYRHALPHPISSFWANLPGRSSAVIANCVKRCYKVPRISFQKHLCWSGLALLQVLGFLSPSDESYWLMKCWLRTCHSISSLGVVGWAGHGQQDRRGWIK